MNIWKIFEKKKLSGKINNILFINNKIMANRSYLYSCNSLPKNVNKKSIIKWISEWNYEIPIVYKILLSWDTEMSSSLIWDSDEQITIVGSYEKGINNLYKFLELLEKNEKTEKLINETKTFLNDKSNKLKYFILENLEIFELNEQNLEEQNKKLLKEINNINKLIIEWKKINIDKLWLGNWSNILYYDLNNSQSQSNAIIEQVINIEPEQIISGKKYWSIIIFLMILTYVIIFFIKQEYLLIIPFVIHSIVYYKRYQFNDIIEYLASVLWLIQEFILIIIIPVILAFGTPIVINALK